VGGQRIDELLRELAPRVLAVVARRYEGFDLCEDAVQEALLAAATQWPEEGVPGNPTGWLITAASRRRIEGMRTDAARRRREDGVFARDIAVSVPSVDDTLTLYLLCCHPSLTSASQLALTLRAVGGLTTAEIARAFLVPEATIAQRISRAKARIKASGTRFRPPPAGELPDRLNRVLQVLYLIFTEGHTASSGAALHRVELTGDAIRLTRQLLVQRPDDGETAGLLALMLLTEARRDARTAAGGALVPLAEQDRSMWNRDQIREGTALVQHALRSSPVGPYQLQAAIAALHDEAPRAEDTDWHEILGLYELLQTIAPGPMVRLSRIVAVAMVRGPRQALTELAAAVQDPVLARHHRVPAVRAHLLDMAGDAIAARQQYRLAARRTLSQPERGYLESRARSCPSDAGPGLGEH
jgi:predicted RNA polymerase sigma factor